MNNSLDELNTAILLKWKNNSWLSSNTKGLFQDLAPENIKYPYAIFYIEADSSYVAQGYSQLVSIQFNVFSYDKKPENKKEINNVLMNIKEEYEGQELVMEDYTNSISPKIGKEHVFINDSLHYQGTIFFKLWI